MPKPAPSGASHANQSRPLLMTSCSGRHRRRPHLSGRCNIGGPCELSGTGVDEFSCAWSPSQYDSIVIERPMHVDFEPNRAEGSMGSALRPVAVEGLPQHGDGGAGDVERQMGGAAELRSSNGAVCARWPQSPNIGVSRRRRVAVGLLADEGSTKHLRCRGKAAATACAFSRRAPCFSSTHPSLPSDTTVRLEGDGGGSGGKLSSLVTSSLWCDCICIRRSACLRCNDIKVQTAPQLPRAHGLWTMTGWSLAALSSTSCKAFIRSLATSS
mmetsp:Transcript_18165/g.52454  ORF Transcript_18165/g.52454 Transcript_18165/m.52454 type:complete len:270 (+) Transcript_18165:243-1052(+)